MIAGLITPDQGKIVVNREVLYCSQTKINLPTYKRKVGYVFQDSRLFPHYSVKGNLLYGVRAFDQAHFDEIISLLALLPLLERLPVDLSGGEKQRVAIGRALLSKPDILLMDEPLASLDLPRKREVMPFLEELADKVELPIIYVSHSLSEILRLASHLVVLDKGKLVSNGKLEDVWASQAMKPWQSFSEQSSVFEAQVAENNHEYGLTRILLAPETPMWVQQVSADIGTHVRVQVRSNDVSICCDKPTKTSFRNVIPATIESIESYASGNERQSVSVKLQIAPQCYLWATITTWARDELELKKGMPVYAQIKGVSVTQRDIAIAHSTD